ncbi:vWA domain-containing protein [Muriicola sp. Z0-33]|uniref:vWA domain-containing protein n=1 Tax=Muriicola sp. Z0-33 TaxID=2816957 RepID=UPI002237E9F1|nr:VWA domain-containing protein [Muriicola sp. Z0-33]MCW5516988.1 VWA domain-containing protein [Muriicola sp. Z0-33]
MHQPSLIAYRTALSANMLYFCRFLRNKGFNLGPSEEADALNAISLVPIGEEKFFRQSLKTVLAKNNYQFNAFNDLYTEFWDQYAKAVNSKLKEDQPEKNTLSDAQKKEAQFNALKDWLNLSPSTEEISLHSYSAIEVLTKKNFQDLSDDEMLLMMSLLKRLARKIAHQKSRLKKRTKKRRIVDIKRTIRDNMRYGGEMQRLVYSKRKDRRLKLVLLCDVSKSMDLYSRFFVHLIYAFQNAYDKIETFVFSTALHKVSEMLNNHEFEKAFDTISERVPHWSGGTTIGSCLLDFNLNYGHSHLDKKTIVFILSDGWDTGDPLTMKAAMKFIYKKSRKVIWLNPLAGNPEFSPDAMGMKTALPYIDTLVSAHNLDSLKQAIHASVKRRDIMKNQFYS